jgi:hypothetical protein
MSDLEDYVTAACLVIFDCRDDAKGRPWDEKIYWREEAVTFGTVMVVGC